MDETVKLPEILNGSGMEQKCITSVLPKFPSVSNDTIALSTVRMKKSSLERAKSEGGF